MANYVEGRTSQDSRRNGHLFRLLVAIGVVVALATLLLSGAATSGTAHAQTAGGTYHGSIDGGGTIDIVVTDDGQGIAAVMLDQYVTYCDVITTTATIDPPEPIDEDGFFSAMFEAGPPALPVLIGVGGWFVGDETIEGFILATAMDPQCDEEARAFTASLVAEEAEEEEEVVIAPATGSGIATSPNAHPMAVLLVAAMLGAMGLAATGLGAIRHHRG